jgi:6-phosphogluconolactonase (cycloisomerase 2 family)
MRILNRGCLLICLFVTCLILAACAPFGQAKSMSSNIKLLIQMGQSEYAAGEPVRLNVIISNGSKDPLQLGGSAFDVSSFNITMQDAKGQLVALTHYGKHLLAPPMAVFRNVSVQIPAGEQRRYQFNLSRLFDLSRSGAYLVSVKRTIVTGYKRLPNGILQSQTAELIADPIRIKIFDSSALRSGIEPISPPPLKRQYLYLVNSQNRNDNDHGVVVRYQINADGTVSPTLRDITPAGKHSVAIVIGRDGKFAYVLNYGDESISQFRIGDNGVLTPLPQATVSTGKYPVALSIDPTGRWVTAVSTWGTQIYRVGKEGVLTPLSSKTYPLHSTEDVVFSSDGRFVYTSNGDVSQSRIEADGSITPLTPDYVRADNPRAMAIDASGRYLYVLTNHDFPIIKGKPHTSEQVITPFQIKNDGTLSQLGESVSPRDAGIATCCLNALYVNDRYLYAINENKGDILQYEIAVDGRLKFKTSNSARSAGWPVDLVFDDAHHFAYAADYRNSIATYQVNSQGELKPIGINIYNDGYGLEKLVIGQAPIAPPPLVFKNGIEMSACIEREVYNPDVPVILTVTLKSSGAQPLPSTSAAVDVARFEIVIKNDRGETMPLLSHGKELLNPIENSFRITASKERQYKFVLNRLFDITEAGIYTMIVERHAVNSNGTDNNPLSTNPLYFKIDNPYDELPGGYREELPEGYHYANGIGVPISQSK